MELISVWHKLIKIEDCKEINNEYPLLAKLSSNEISVITMTASKPDIILKDICEEINLPKSTLTHLINRLERKGYIRRVISKQDLRSCGLELTDMGTQAEKQHKAYEKMIDTYITSILTEEEKKQLVTILSKIADSFTKEE